METCKSKTRSEHWPYHGGRCSRKVWKDGYCKQHHPDEKRKRQAERDAKWEKKFKAKQALRDRRTEDSEMGRLFRELGTWAGTYAFSFQFWGEGNNNVFIQKDHVDLYDSGGHLTPKDAIQDALDYIKRINPTK